MLVAIVLGRPVETVDKILREAIRKDLDPYLVAALVEQESGFYWLAENVNEDGSTDFGWFQINDKYHEQFRNNKDLHIDKGLEILLVAMIVEGWDWERALARYNAGENRSGAGTIYAGKVLRKYYRLKLNCVIQINQIN
jgi:soluble lytic murein transglycosylase-like protein